MNFKVGQIGYGFVGSALHKSFKKRGLETLVYDKYPKLDPLPEEDYPVIQNSIKNLKHCDILFLCLPTPYVAGHGYDLGALLENIRMLNGEFFQGLIVIKSTIEPGTTQRFADQFPRLKFSHNPEFLTARTAQEDFDNQKHIVLGKVSQQYHKNNVEVLDSLYRELYPDAKVSICTSEESESMKIFANNFYAMKVQIFNEFKYLCQKTGADYNKVKDLMIENGWINPMHTSVPGPDGLPSYGGFCFPKDTNALLHFMKTHGSPHKVLEATVEERNEMREEKWK